MQPNGDYLLIWRTQDGRSIPVTVLEDDHLLNAERWARGDGETVPDHLAEIRSKYHAALVRQLAYRGMVPLIPVEPEVRRARAARDAAAGRQVQALLDDEYRYGNPYDYTCYDHDCAVHYPGGPPR